MRAGQVVLALFVLGLVLTPFAIAAAAKSCDLDTLKTEYKCGSCSKKMEKAAECCGKAAAGIEYCVKTHYNCACGSTSDKAKECCGSAMAKSEDKAKTLWTCPKCKAKASAKGQCAACEKDLVKTCEKSGKAPHVASAAKAEKGASKKAG